MLHNVRFVTKGTETHVFLDNLEVHGCIAANIDYQTKALPVVNLQLTAMNIEVEAEHAEVNKNLDEPIETLGLTEKTVNILHDGIWHNKNHEELRDPVLTVGKLLEEYTAGRLLKYKGLGAHRHVMITRALKEKNLI